MRASVAVFALLALVFCQGQLSADERWTPVQVALWPDLQLFSGDTDVYGLRLTLPVGEQQNVTGLDIGFLNFAGNVRGMQAGVLGNVAGETWGQVGLLFWNSQLHCNYADKLRGFQISPVCNAAKDLVGLQIGGLVNASLGTSRGLQLALLINGAGSDESDAPDAIGIQMAGACNLVQRGHFSGLQISPGLNWVSRGKASGLQLACVNYAQDLSGIQLGLVNACRTKRGIQVGLLNINTDDSLTLCPLVHAEF